LIFGLHLEQQKMFNLFTIQTGTLIFKEDVFQSTTDSRRKQLPLCVQHPRRPRRFVWCPIVFIISISL